MANHCIQINDLEETVPGARWVELLQQMGQGERWVVRAIEKEPGVAAAFRDMLFSARMERMPEGGVSLQLEVDSHFPASLGVATRAADGTVAYDVFYAPQGNELVRG